MPKVSVLIKSFNHAPYIAQCIESVLSQSFQDFEIVVTDDASTDATAEVVRRFDDSRIRLEINRRNLGISGAMNATIARARGAYLAILNSDDWALPGRLQTQVDFLDANPHIGVVAGLPRPVDEHGEPTGAYNDFHTPLSFLDFSRRTWLRYFLKDGNCLCAPTVTIRREVYDDVGSYDRSLTNLQDFDMWIRVLLRGHTIHVLPQEVTALRIRAENANMSAVRPDSIMRSCFETSRIMRRFQTLGSGDFEALFGDLATETSGQPLRRRIALLTLQNVRPSARFAALDILAETADDDAAFDSLRELTGRHDIFGSESLRQLGIAHNDLYKSHERTWQDAERLRGENARLREARELVVQHAERLREENAKLHEARNHASLTAERLHRETSMLQAARDQARLSAERLRQENTTLQQTRAQARQDAERLREENAALNERLEKTFGHRVGKTIGRLRRSESVAR